MPNNASGKWHLIVILGHSYALSILDALNERPLRFTDLARYVPNERTRSQRLRQLEEKDLIHTISIKIDKRYFIHYSLTEKGKLALQKAKEIIELGK